MHYDNLPTDKNYFFGIYSVLLFIVGGLLVFAVLLLRKRKFLAFKWMATSFTCYTVGIFFLWAGFIEPYMTGVKGLFYQASVAIMELCIVAGQCFFLVLIATVFDYSVRRLKASIIIGAIIGILVVLPNNYYGVFPEPEYIYGPDIRLYTQAAWMLFSFVVHGGAFRIAFREFKHAEEIGAQSGFLFLSLSQLVMIGSFVFMILDVIAFTSWGEINGYSIFLALAWCASIMSLCLLYMTLAFPTWFRILKKSGVGSQQALSEKGTLSLIGIVYSIFDQRVGPIPLVFEPANLPQDLALMAAASSMSFKKWSGEKCPREMSVIPFPKQQVKSIIKFLSYRDENLRGGKGEATLSLLVKEENDLLFYKNIKNLESAYDQFGRELIELNEDKAPKEEIAQKVQRIMFLTKVLIGTFA